MTELTVLYDPQCGLCRRLQGWLANKPKYVELVFVPVDSEVARARFPRLDHARTRAELAVITDQGAVYWDAKAWLMVLWSLGEYRAWSFRLSSPELMPTAKRVISMISQNRSKLDGMGKVLLKDS